MSSDFQLIHLPEVDSTNNYLKTISESSSIDVPIVLIVDNQTDGKGQHNNKWESKPKKNLLLSILIQEIIPAEKSFYLSKITALAIQSLLEKEIGELVQVKWTNDIYVGDKKIAGILIENTMKGNKITQSIIGVGLNLNQMKFSNKLPNPVSLKQITGKTYRIEDFGIKFYNEFYKFFLKFQQGFFQFLDNDYNRVLYKKNEWVPVVKNNAKQIVKILSVNKDGYLLVENESREKKQFAYGEIRFL